MAKLDDRLFARLTSKNIDVPMVSGTARHGWHPAISDSLPRLLTPTNVMLNVRVDSLSSDRRIAARDCRQCTKRRIKCDRSTPNCRKCTIREYQCPGYDSFQLKWDHKKAVNKLHSRVQRTRRLGDQAKATTSTHNSQNRESCQQLDYHSPGDYHTDLRILLEDPSADHCLVDGHTWSVLATTLFAHFSCHVTPRLTWVDRPDHPWRTVISPLATRNNCLRLSVLSLAAAHLSVTSRNNLDAHKTRTISRRLRDLSIHALNRKIGLEIAGYTSGAKETDSNLIEIMATTLVLCYGEMMIPNSTDWKLHLHACGTLIKRYSWCGKPGKHSDAIDFIVKEVADIEVFRNMGAFARDQVFIADIIRPQTTLDSYFKTFMGLFREITSEERIRQNLLKGGRSLPMTDMAIWLDKAKNAYMRASTDTAWLSTIHEDISRQRMEATIRAVYHAVCIYSHQALAADLESRTRIESSITSLEYEIEFLTTGSAHMFSHDIFVPLFILGTECWGDKAKQERVEAQFMDLLSSTGIWCNSTALQFLKCYWKSNEFHVTRNWIQYARETEEQNGPFLVF